MRRPYKILFILLAAIILTVIVVVANMSRSHSQVRGIEARLRYGRTPHLVEGQTVVDSVLRALPQLLSTRVSDVDRSAVATAASKVPYLTDVSVNVSVSGKVVIHAAQRRPIARLFYGNRELYFDSHGAMMPVSPLSECSVLVAGGDFTEPLVIDSLNSQTQALVDLARHLDSEPHYGRMIDQIYIERDGDMMMVPKLGDHVIELGSVDNLDTKFAHLLAFYRKGMPRTGWDTYSRISLKFDGQVVCTKRKKSENRQKS